MSDRTRRHNARLAGTLALPPHADSANQAARHSTTHGGRASVPASRNAARQITRRLSLGALLIALAVALLLLPAAALAAVTGQAGPYQVSVTTDPAEIPVGRAKLLIAVTADGKPVEGAQVTALAQMPSMAMGETEQTATPAPGKPGTYVAPAQFAMAGGYNATIKVTGPHGAGTAVIPLETGQNTAGTAGGFSALSLLPWLLVAAAVAFVVYRMRATGQGVNLRAANRQTLGGLLLLIVMAAGAWYAINHYRRPGAMTPMEAQAMEMSTPAPPGTAPVELAMVTEGPVESTVRYTGQAVGFVEQDVYPRVQGWITQMPYYVGARVTRGQVLARLDTSQLQPQVAQQQAAVSMASQGVDVAQREYQQALAAVNQARAETRGKRDAIAGAQADLAAAREDRANAQADLTAMQTQVADAEAQLQAAQADQQYWKDEIARMRTLLKAGAVSQEEFQREQSQAAGSDAKVRQAQARVSQVEAQVSAGQAQVRKADAAITAAGKKVQQMTSEASAADAAVRSAQAASAASRQRISQARAGVSQAQAGLAGATTSRGYTEIRSEVDGVITQRLISPGVLVNPGQAILRVAQLDPIRLQANVAEADLGRVRVGARVVVRGQTDGNRPVIARVSSVAPAVDPATRTAVVEAIVPNRPTRFVPGQYVVMDISTGGSARALRVPTRAIQTRTNPSGVISTGTSSYVWVADAGGSAGQYTVHPIAIQTGASDGAYTQLTAGLKPGQDVVVAGYQYLKDGDTVAAAPTSHQTAESASPAASSAPAQPESGAMEATVAITEKGFEPGTVTLMAGMPAKLTFIRKTDKSCGTEVVLPDYGIRKPLPLNQPVVVELTPKKGEFAFTCGMNMLRGKVVAR